MLEPASVRRMWKHLICSTLFLLAAACTTTTASQDAMPSVSVDLDTIRPMAITTVGPISDESYRSFGECSGNKGIYGMQCMGRYCDNVYLFCEDLPTGAQLNHAYTWTTDWFSEEQPDGANCWHGPENHRGIVTGLYCSGSYCDRMKLKCTDMGTGEVVPPTATSSPFSEEHPAQHWSWPAVGMKCSGRYCDSIIVWTNQVQL